MKLQFVLFAALVIGVSSKAIFKRDNKYGDEAVAPAAPAESAPAPEAPAPAPVEQAPAPVEQAPAESAPAPSQSSGY
uniref:Uncharacterized protein n=1 Tax=Panagrolaimus sp. PS1159 TaxID=55785 RepID=A0AC35GL80_9BILA